MAFQNRKRPFGKVEKYLEVEQGSEIW